MKDRVQAVERALALLNQIAEAGQPVTIDELSEAQDIHRVTVWRLLNSLEQFDLVERDEITKRYRIGYGTVHLSGATDVSTLLRIAHPTMEQLAKEVDGNVFLEVASSSKLIVLGESKPTSPITADIADLEVPLHCGSVGKLFLSSLTNTELDQFFSKPLQKCTPHTITDPHQLRSEIATCQTTGLAFNYKEHQEEWCGACAAIRNKTGRDLAYLNVTFPTYRMNEQQLKQLSEPISTAALAVQERLTN